MNPLNWIFGRKSEGVEDRAENWSGPRAEVTVGPNRFLTDPNVEAFLRGETNSVTGGLISPRRALSIATAYRCVNLITGAIGAMTLDIKQRDKSGNRQDRDDHPVAKLMRRRPNHWQTPSEFIKKLQRDVLLRGNGYALKSTSRGAIRALIPLNPDRMKIKQNPDLTLAYEYSRPGGGMSTFQQSEIFHLRGHSDDTITGDSVISYAAKTLILSDITRQHSDRLFRNGTSIGNIFRHPKRLSEVVVARFKAQLDEFRGSGSSNSHGDLILEEDMKHEKIGMSSVDAQLLQIMDANDYQVAMFFGVPPHLLGLTSKQTSFGSGIEQMSIGFIAYTLEDWMTLWAQTIQRDLLTETEVDSGYYAKHNPASLIRGDIKTRYAAYASGRQWGFLSVNDIRAKEDENGIGPAGDVYLTPVNMADSSTPKESGDPNNDPSSASGGA
jgi:HK97 family phage portal protein